MTITECGHRELCPHFCWPEVQGNSAVPYQADPHGTFRTSSSRACANVLTLLQEGSIFMLVRRTVIMDSEVH